ncbi:CD225/dispanin family protein [bacterium]|nr:CD225/dispanin family protein [candidate division CSSED10-310 bacterium]
MFCRKCGTENDDNAYRCIRCGEIIQTDSAQAAPVREYIPNYLAQSILVTLFCCLPAGIPAIVFSSQVNGKVQAGDITGAKEASNNAKMWSWISFGLGLTGGLIYLIFVMFAIAAEKY